MSARSQTLRFAYMLNNAVKHNKNHFDWCFTLSNELKKFMTTLVDCGAIQHFEHVSVSLNNKPSIKVVRVYPPYKQGKSESSLHLWTSNKHAARRFKLSAFYKHASNFQGEHLLVSTTSGILTSALCLKSKKGGIVVGTISTV